MEPLPSNPAQRWRVPSDVNTTIAPRNLAMALLACHREGAVDTSRFGKKNKTFQKHLKWTYLKELFFVVKSVPKLWNPPPLSPKIP